MPLVCSRYALFPNEEDWVGKILLLETSEEKMPPEKFYQALTLLKETGIFDSISGLLVGKPMDEVYSEEYKRLLFDVIANPSLAMLNPAASFLLA